MAVSLKHCFKIFLFYCFSTLLFNPKNKLSFVLKSCQSLDQSVLLRIIPNASQCAWCCSRMVSSYLQIYVCQLVTEGTWLHGKNVSERKKSCLAVMLHFLLKKSAQGKKCFGLSSTWKEATERKTKFEFCLFGIKRPTHSNPCILRGSLFKTNWNIRISLSADPFHFKKDFPKRSLRKIEISGQILDAKCDQFCAQHRRDMGKKCSNHHLCPNKFRLFSCISDCTKTQKMFRFWANTGGLFGGVRFVERSWFRCLHGTQNTFLLTDSIELQFQYFVDLISHRFCATH